MNSSRFVALAFAALLAAPLAAAAQAVPAAPGASAQAPIAGARHHHGNRYMRALHALDLTAAQKTQIQAFTRTAKAANKNADPATRKANRQQLQSEINGVLTPDQRVQLQAEIAKGAPAAK